MTLTRTCLGCEGSGAPQTCDVLRCPSCAGTGVAKPAKPVLSAGKAVIERGEGDRLLLMLPDGDVVSKSSPSHALCAVKSWSARNPDFIIVLEWRDGIEPPQES